MEINLQKPLRSHYRMRERDYQIQYDGLSDLCFCCGKYGHREAHYSLKKPSDPKANSSEAARNEDNPKGPQEDRAQNEQRGLFASWVVGQRTRWCSNSVQKTIMRT